MAKICAYPEGPLASVAYVIVLDSQSVLIDPSVPPEKITDAIPPVRKILATHGHIDHLIAVDSWRDLTQADLWIHAADAACLTNPAYNLSALMGQSAVFREAEHSLADGQIIDLDEHHRIQVWHTPGHTNGSVCYLLEVDKKAEALFSGDTVFSRSIGRTDLGGGNDESMRLSLKGLTAKAQALGLTDTQDLPVFCGHGPQTALLDEIKNNPYWPV